MTRLRVLERADYPPAHVPHVCVTACAELQMSRDRASGESSIVCAMPMAIVSCRCRCRDSVYKTRGKRANPVLRPLWRLEHLMEGPYLCNEARM